MKRTILSCRQALGKGVILLLLCFLLGFALRFYTFDRKSLWMDEIYTYQDSRDDLRGQIRFYQEEPDYLHPPLFYVLTHLLHPFEKPERDLRIIPLISGALSIPMLYFLAGSFSPVIGFPCALTLSLMTYHISLSQDGRTYTLVLFLSMAALYFLMRHLKTGKRGCLFPAGLLYAALFYASYSAIPFVVFSQVLWLYRVTPDQPKPRLSSFFLLNGMILLLCAPWILFLLSHLKGQMAMNPFHKESAGSLGTILYGILYDWVPYPPLLVVSVVLLVLFPFLAPRKQNALFLLAAFLLPVLGLYAFCWLFNVTHFVTSRYFICFMPLFFVVLFLSLGNIEAKFGKIRKWARLTPLFLILLIASNLLILPFYYRAEKQDFRGLAQYLKGHLRRGDKIFVQESSFMPAILHYLEVQPKGRHHKTSPSGDVSKGNTDFRIDFAYQGKVLSIHHSKTCCERYVSDGNRLWVVATQWAAKEIRRDSPYALKGFFDGSFLNFNRFPTDASMYLFLWDPSNPNDRGLDLKIE